MSEPAPMRAAISESKKSKHRFQIGAAIAKELDWKALLFISTGITIT